jgi:hypothetical protein
LCEIFVVHDASIVFCLGPFLFRFTLRLWREKSYLTAIGRPCVRLDFVLSGGQCSPFTTAHREHKNLVAPGSTRQEGEGGAVGGPAWRTLSFLRISELGHSTARDLVNPDVSLAFCSLDWLGYHKCNTLSILSNLEVG